MVNKWLKHPITVFGKRMPLQRFLFFVLIACIVYFVFFEVSEKHYCLLIDHNYGYSIEFPANRVVHVFGKLGNHGWVDEKAVFYPRTLPFLQTSAVNIYWTDETKDSVELMRSWGTDQFSDDWQPTSGLKPVLVGQGNYDAWTTTFRRDSWQSRHYYIPSENGTFLIEFTQLGTQNHLNAIKNRMVASFLIDEAFTTDKEIYYQGRTIDCFR
jgi:hypothetical protein